MTKDAKKEQNKMLTVKEYLDKCKHHIVKGMPRDLGSVDFERMSRTALSEIKKNPSLANATPDSVMKGIMGAAYLGLEIGNGLGHAYLVPFKNKAGIYEATLIVGYQGLMELAYRSTEVLSIEAHEVYENDEFDFQYGLDGFLKHKPVRKRGELMAVYAIATLKNGQKQFEVLWREDIEHAKSFSRSADKSASPWKNHYAAMAKKTAIRRLAKFIPKSAQLHEAANLREDNDFDGSYFDYIDLPTSEYSENETKSDRLAEAL
jgi:recombination protein RecT